MDETLDWDDKSVEGILKGMVAPKPLPKAADILAKSAAAAKAKAAKKAA